MWGWCLRVSLCRRRRLSWRCQDEAGVEEADVDGLNIKEARLRRYVGHDEEEDDVTLDLSDYLEVFDDLMADEYFVVEADEHVAITARGFGRRHLSKRSTRFSW